MLNIISMILGGVLPQKDNTTMDAIEDRMTSYDTDDFNSGLDRSKRQCPTRRSFYFFDRRDCNDKLHDDCVHACEEAAAAARVAQIEADASLARQCENSAISFRWLPRCGG